MPVELVLRFTVVAVVFVVAFPKASSSVTVNALVAWEFAAPANGVELMAKCVSVPAVMVFLLHKVPERSVPWRQRWMVGVPEAVSP